METHACAALVAMLNEEDITAHRAREAIFKIGQSAVPALRNAVTDLKFHRRSVAIEVIGEIGVPCQHETIQSLIGALDLRKSNSPSVRLEAAAALEKLKWQPGSSHDRLLVALAKQNWQAAVAEGQIAFQPLLTLLRDRDHDIWSDAASALGDLGLPQAVEHLISALGHEPDPHHGTTKVFKGLVKLGRPAVKPLLDCLNGPVGKEDRYSIVNALGKIGDSAAVETLVGILANRSADKETGCHVAYSNLSLREEAVRAIGAIRNASGVEALIARLTDKDEIISIKCKAATALGAIGDDRAVMPLIDLLRNS